MFQLKSRWCHSNIYRAHHQKVGPQLTLTSRRADTIGLLVVPISSLIKQFTSIQILFAYHESKARRSVTGAKDDGAPPGELSRPPSMLIAFSDIVLQELRLKHNFARPKRSWGSTFEQPTYYGFGSSRPAVSSLQPDRVLIIPLSFAQKPCLTHQIQSC